MLVSYRQLFLLPAYCLAAGLAVGQVKHPDVPMTRSGEMLAEHNTNFFHSSTWVELEGGRVLHAAGSDFITSDDGGITWSKPFKHADTQGNPVGGRNTSLVKLAGAGIGLAARIYDRTAGSMDPDRMISGGAKMEARPGNPHPNYAARASRRCVPGRSADSLRSHHSPASAWVSALPLGRTMELLPFFGKLVRNQWVSDLGALFRPRIHGGLRCLLR